MRFLPLAIVLLTSFSAHAVNRCILREVDYNGRTAAQAREICRSKDYECISTEMEYGRNLATAQAICGSPDRECMRSQINIRNRSVSDAKIICEEPESKRSKGNTFEPESFELQIPESSRF